MMSNRGFPGYHGMPEPPGARGTKKDPNGRIRPPGPRGPRGLPGQRDLIPESEPFSQPECTVGDTTCGDDGAP